MTTPSSPDQRRRPLRAVGAVLALSVAMAGGAVVLTAGAGMATAGATAPVTTGTPTPTETGTAPSSPSPSATVTETPAPTPTVVPTPVPASAPIRIAQANIRGALNATETMADIATVYAYAPDFVTFNEVPGRPDSWLAPSGYGLFRTPGTYTGATPVAYNMNRWTLLNSGTHLISNVPGKSPGQKVEWGIRYANWITVQSTAGQVVSVISTHFAPPDTKFTQGLTGPSLTALGSLAATLNQRGPVLIGGDLNVNYREVAKYPRAQMAALGLTPTYDVMGQSLPTGDQRGATIDYILMRSAGQFAVQGQWTHELLSDHKMLAADVALLGASAQYFVPGTVVNDDSSPNRVNALVNSVLDKAPKGANIRILTRELSGGPLLKAIQRADKRGVKVAVITGSTRLTPVEKKLAALLGTKTGKKKYLTQKPGYWKKRKQFSRAVVTASASGGTTALRLDVNRPLAKDSRKKRMVAHLRTTKGEYDWFFKKFEKLRQK